MRRDSRARRRVGPRRPAGARGLFPELASAVHLGVRACACSLSASYGDYVHHSDMAAYLEAYAAAFGLNRHIRLRTTVESALPDGEHWRVRLDGAEQRRS